MSPPPAASVSRSPKSRPPSWKSDAYSPVPLRSAMRVSGGGPAYRGASLFRHCNILLSSATRQPIGGRRSDQMGSPSCFSIMPTMRRPGFDARCALAAIVRRSAPMAFARDADRWAESRCHPSIPRPPQIQGVRSSASGYRARYQERKSGAQQVGVFPGSGVGFPSVGEMFLWRIRSLTHNAHRRALRRNIGRGRSTRRR